MNVNDQTQNPHNCAEVFCSANGQPKTGTIWHMNNIVNEQQGSWTSDLYGRVSVICVYFRDLGMLCTLGKLHRSDHIFFAKGHVKTKP